MARLAVLTSHIRDGHVVVGLVGQGELWLAVVIEALFQALEGLVQVEVGEPEPLEFYLLLLDLLSHDLPLFFRAPIVAVRLRPQPQASPDDLHPLIRTKPSLSLLILKVLLPGYLLALTDHIEMVLILEPALWGLVAILDLMKGEVLLVQIVSLWIGHHWLSLALKVYKPCRHLRSIDMTLRHIGTHHLTLSGAILRRRSKNWTLDLLGEEGSASVHEDRGM